MMKGALDPQIQRIGIESVGAGFTRSSANVCSAFLADDHARMPDNATGKEE